MKSQAAGGVVDESNGYRHALLGRLMSHFQNNTFLVSLLELTRDRRAVSVDEFVDSCLVGPSLAKESLKELESQGLIDIRDDLILTQMGNRLVLALRLISDGVDPEAVSKALAWGEFESLVSKIFELDGYLTQRHTVVKDGRRRFEIDVLAARKPAIVSMDCKHWKRSWLRSAYSEIAGKQVERTRALSLLANLRRKLDVDGWGWADLFPAVVTLSETPVVICDGVPVISVYKLRGFLREFESNRYMLKRIHVELEDIDANSRGLWKRT